MTSYFGNADKTVCPSKGSQLLHALRLADTKMGICGRVTPGYNSFCLLICLSFSHESVAKQRSASIISSDTCSPPQQSWKAYIYLSCIKFYNQWVTDHNLYLLSFYSVSNSMLWDCYLTQAFFLQASYASKTCGSTPKCIFSEAVDHWLRVTSLFLCGQAVRD